MDITKLRKDVVNIILEEQKMEPLYVERYCKARNIALATLQTALNKMDVKITLDYMRFTPIVDQELFPFPLDGRRERIQLTNCPVEWITTDESEKDHAIINFHGGAYVLGGLDGNWTIPYNIAKSTNVRVLNVGYRLAPENPYPAGLEDALEAYKWVLNQKIHPENIIIMGSSAGGGLALALLLKLRHLGIKMPRSAILFSPWTDLTFSTQSLIDNADYDTLDLNTLKLAAKFYCGSHDPKLPYISPLYADFKGLPDLYFDFARKELIAEEIEKTAQKADLAGVNVICKSWDEMLHVFQFYSGKLPEATQSMLEICNYIQKLFGLSEK